jgi:hypothetical protein
MTLPELLAQYEARIRELQIGLEHARYHGGMATAALVLALLLSAVLMFRAVQQQVSFLWPSISLPLVTAAARRMHVQRRSSVRLARLRRFYDRSLQRLHGNWAGTGIGIEFDDPDHIYARDLNLFGEASLFELLCTARTGIGRWGLAQYLLTPPCTTESLSRQDAVRELSGNLNLRERLAVLGKFDFSEAGRETFIQWLDSPPLVPRFGLRISALATSFSVAILFLGSVAGLIPWHIALVSLAPLFVFQAIVGLVYQGRVRKMLDWLLPIALEIRLLREGLHVMSEQSFQSGKLRRLTEIVGNGSATVRKLERLLNALLERNKEMFYHPSLALLLATQICWAVERWRARHGAELRVWLEAWAEFEALNALANYAFENGNNAYPEFAMHAGSALFEADGLGHPLIPSHMCIPNDLRLNAQSRFYLISGSNMSGKSTLLRAIGLNAVLANAGAPVRAGMLRLSELSVGASLSIVDSLQNGKSKFMAEVDRLRRILAIDRKVPVLFLIDEIFAGTNSRDRRIAAEAVVRALISRGAIGALSTHDLALSEIADAADLGGINVHTGSRDGSDPMDFDYRLKAGVTRESNALAIARMAGVPIL